MHSRIAKIFLSLALLFSIASNLHAKAIEIANDSSSFSPLYGSVFSRIGARLSEASLKKFKVGKSNLYKVPLKVLHPFLNLQKGEAIQIVSLLFEKIESHTIGDDVYVILYDVDSMTLPNVGIVLSNDQKTALEVSKSPPNREKPDGFVYVGKKRTFSSFNFKKFTLKDIPSSDPVRLHSDVVFHKATFVKRILLFNFEIVVYNRSSEGPNNYSFLIRKKKDEYRGAHSNTSFLDESTKNLVFHEFSKGIYAMGFFSAGTFEVVFISNELVELVPIGGNLDYEPEF